MSERLPRRNFLQAASALILAVSPVGRALAAGPSILAVRVWPAPDYTRVTLEHDQPLRYSQILVKDPDRLVLDLEDVEFNSVLQTLPDKILESNPHIKLIRAGRNRPGVVRLVIELKGEVKPQVFALQPVGEYGHRLVLDLYPAEPPDPLMALLEKHTARPAVPGKAQPPAVERLATIVLDPGHGGEDPGAIGRRGSYEKTVTLAIARRLKEHIETEPGMRVVLTRDDDFFIPLHQRVAKARRVKADLFVSIHADAFVKPTARGSSVFVLSENGASSSAAKWLAQRENAADLVGGVNLKVNDPLVAKTLLDMSLTMTLKDSQRLGDAVLAQIAAINTLHKPQVERAGFAVLKAPDIPSILVETAFISNPDEEKRLNDEAYQDKMAEAIVKGIRRYFTRNPPRAKSGAV